ncbi:hypothetical protein GG344DRAFT_79830 [Lentinula edodes]|nr:hypothetical protein GG344DRAFT_79830 [Lentinula edodes]
MSIIHDSEHSILASSSKSQRVGLQSAEKNISTKPNTAVTAPEVPPVPSSPTNSPANSSHFSILNSSDEDEMSTRINESEDLDDLYEDARRYAKAHTKDDIENVRDTITEAFYARVHRDWFCSEKTTHLALAC